MKPMKIKIILHPRPTPIKFQLVILKTHEHFLQDMVIMINRVHYYQTLFQNEGGSLCGISDP